MPETEKTLEGLTARRGLVPELQRRRVCRTALWYLGGSAAVVEGADLFLPALYAPPGTIRLLALLAMGGFPVAIALAWAYDVTPDAGPGVPRPGWLRRAAVAVVALVSLSGAAALWRWRLPELEGVPSGPPRPASHVALLSFQAPDDEPELQAFANHLHERLIDGLSAAAVAAPADERLRVISRAGVLPFSVGDFTTDSIGRALNVGTLVGGTVEEIDGWVRVTLRLVNPSTAEQLGATVARARLGDRLTLTDAVADSVGWLLRRELGPVVRERVRLAETRSSEAYDRLVRAEGRQSDFDVAFKGRSFDRARRRLEEADALYAEAERLDPLWIEPIVRRGLLADRWEQLASAEGDPDRARIHRAGLEHAERALALDPDDHRALALRGAVRHRLAISGLVRDPAAAARLLRGAEDDLLAAAEMNPRPASSLRRLSEVHAAQGRLDEAIRYGERAYAEDPYLDDAGPTLLRLFQYSLSLDRDADASRWCAEGTRRFPDEAVFEDCRLVLMAWSSASKPDPDSAWALYARELGSYPGPLRPRLEPRLRGLVAAVLARAGAADSARVVLRQLREIDSTMVGATLTAAGVHALLGQPDSALALVERVLRTSPDRRSTMAPAPELRPLRSDPRLRTLLGDGVTGG